MPEATCTTLRMTRSPAQQQRAQSHQRRLRIAEPGRDPLWNLHRAEPTITNTKIQLRTWKSPLWKKNITQRLQIQIHYYNEPKRALFETSITQSLQRWTKKSFSWDLKILICTSSAPSRSKPSWKKFSRRPFSGVEGLDRLLGIRLVVLDVLAIWKSPSLVRMLSNYFWVVKPFEVWNK